MDRSGAEMAAAAATEGTLGEEVAGRHNEAIATEVVQREEEVGEHNAETVAAWCHRKGAGTAGKPRGGWLQREGMGHKE